MLQIASVAGRSIGEPLLRRLTADEPGADAAIAHLGVPRILFGTNTTLLLEAFSSLGPEVVGVDWRIPLDDAWERLGPGRAIQGNLDPGVLLGPQELVVERAKDVLARAGGRPGHIFNLGHGVLPDTPVDNLKRLVDLVHTSTAA